MMGWYFLDFCSHTFSGKGGVTKLGAVKILALPKLPRPPPPYPNPGTLVDLTTKARKCDSQHFDIKKVRKLPFFGVNDYFLGKCSLIVGDDQFWGIRRSLG